MLEADLSYAETFSPMTDDEIDELYRNTSEYGNYVCRQCGKCISCPEGIPIPEIFRLESYYDTQIAVGTVTNASDYELKEGYDFGLVIRIWQWSVIQNLI